LKIFKNVLSQEIAANSGTGKGDNCHDNDDDFHATSTKLKSQSISDSKPVAENYSLKTGACLCFHLRLLAVIC
jgi:hypothetical protein